MAFGYVQQTTGSTATGSGSYASTAFGSSVTVGNTLIAIVSSDGNNASQVTGLTDNKGNTWTRVFEGMTTRYVSVWRAPVTAGGAGLVITVTYNAASSNNSGIVAQEWSSAGAFTKDQTKAGTGTSATPTTGASSSTTVANELVVAGVVMTSTEASFTGAGAGYSNAGSALVTNASVAMESKTVASTGAQTATFTWPTSRIYTAILTTYYEASTTQTISPAALASTATIGTPTVSPGAVTLAATAIASTLLIGSPTVTGAYILNPTSLTSTAAIGTPALSPGNVNLAPSALASTVAIGSPTLSPGAVTISATSIGSASSIGTPSLSSAYTLSCRGESLSLLRESVPPPPSVCLF